jgi:hypothetical protein
MENFGPFQTSSKAQVVTLVVSNYMTSSYNLTTNQIVTVNSFVNDQTTGYATALVSFLDGTRLRFRSHAPLEWTSTGGGSFTGYPVLTGATNVTATGSNDLTPLTAALTFTITTPTVQSGVPANAVVIPTDATGPVQIVLESSSDLINWTSSLPGTYGSTYSNRFFRVRAIAQ